VATILISGTEFVQRVTKILNADVQDLAVKVVTDPSDPLETSPTRFSTVARVDTAQSSSVQTVYTSNTSRKYVSFFNDSDRHLLNRLTIRDLHLIHRL